MEKVLLKSSAITSVNTFSLQEPLERGDHTSKRKECPLDKDELGKDFNCLQGIVT
jgi:hypothetical protein